MRALWNGHISHDSVFKGNTGEVYLLFKQFKHTYMWKIATVNRKMQDVCVFCIWKNNGTDFLSANVFWWFSKLLKICQYLLVPKEWFRPYEEPPCWS